MGVCARARTRVCPRACLRSTLQGWVRKVGTAAPRCTGRSGSKESEGETEPRLKGRPRFCRHPKTTRRGDVGWRAPWTTLQALH